MSTQVIETNLELMREELAEFINDELLDMLEVWSADEIAGKVIEMADILMHRTFYDGCFIDFRSRPNKRYDIKVRNQLNAFVSVSDDCTTGVSETLYHPFYAEDESYSWGLCNLAQMLNEAWYSCVNGKES